MRVISGIARATKLYTIDTTDTRPTLDRVKEALFNIIQLKVYNSVVLDLFAGSGALGIEAISRGAKKAVFCDESKYSYDIIIKNLEKTKLKEKAIIYNKDYYNCLNVLNEKFDIIFLDPPYNTDLATKAVEKILEKDLLSYDGIIIIETDDIKKIKGKVITNEIEIYNVRKYGKIKLMFLKRRE